MSEDLSNAFDSSRGKIPFSPEYEELLRRWEALPFNREADDKTWMHRAAEDSRRHFERAKRIQ